MEAQISSSTMDSTNRIKTTVILLVLYGICLYPAVHGDLKELLIMFAVSTCLCIATRGYMPNRFIVDGEKLVIEAYFKRTTIYICEIVSVRPVKELDMGITIRSFGSSWLFGDLGYFSSTVIGNFKVFARRSDNRILIITSDRGQYLIAPDDPAFIDNLNRAVLWR